MFYLIETDYVGPNQSDNIDARRLDISTEPGRTNQSKEIRTEGWLGTTNDWSMIAHGEYSTIGGAVEAAIAVLGEGGGREIRNPSANDDTIVCAWRFGRLKPMGASWSADWVAPCETDITGETTDDLLAETVDDCASCCAVDGMKLDRAAALEALTKIRDDRKAAAEADE